MPTAPTYPGVYVEELPSGVRTIVGVATSVAAFVGRARRGPEDTPVVIHGFGDFERSFGTLWDQSHLGYSVRDFFRNGGRTAVIVRLYAAAAAGPSSATLAVGDLQLEAAAPGAWGNALQVRVDTDTRPPLAELGEDDDTLFNLRLRDGETGDEEQLRNVAVLDGHPRRVNEVLREESQLMRMTGGVPAAPPPAHPDPQPGEDVWEVGAPTNTGVADADRASDGGLLTQADFTGPGTQRDKTGLYSLLRADIFNLLCIPPYTAENDVDAGLWDEAAQLCDDERAMLLIDPPSNWNDKGDATGGIGGLQGNSRNAALFFPRLRQPNPLHDNRLEEFTPSGAVAGAFARTDAQRGVWKAPAGLDTTLVGVPDLTVKLTDPENGELNPLGVNCLRDLPPSGRLIWGSRTRHGDDRRASEWKYIPVRRMALFLEESLYRGTHWAVFEPNDEPLWAALRLNIGAFMHDLFRQGAFKGQAARDAYFVKCDSETTTQNDINLGIVNVVIGFAPLKPAEFVILKFQQIAGQVEA